VLTFNPAEPVIVHPVSVAEKPVPLTLTSVAGAVGGPVTGGEPTITSSVTEGRTWKGAGAEKSPLLVSTHTVYAGLPGTLSETTKAPKKMVPKAMLHIWEAIRFGELDLIVQTPSSSGVGKPPANTEIESPAIPVAGKGVVTGGDETKKVVSATHPVPVGGAASLTLTVYATKVGAVFDTANNAVTVPAGDMEQYVAGVVANSAPVGDSKSQLRGLADVANPPPVTMTRPEPSAGIVPNPGEANAPRGEAMNIVGADTF
jgi:hypothetical protein